ncbi:sugar kinase [Phaeovulum vinaykumarii]|uniref:2-keto-3-deoxygluconate kinase n=1 Tax=Phaeovulum vinaykumarii TaxID=407234 RepID=A0A1N7M8A2_9RHOB|nr:sugar kinase [Phaeovulum vinaykumarii]SIS82304.1 2-keto-3-deoxygluconate kinase [Phaeovulum vinaykumarii]SOC11061.1 2-keto-3-deoxygluconate kinase [Phaeovulum vinaykumarii]
MARALALGECMVELAQTGPGLYRRGFAGDTFNTAWYLRRSLGPDWQVDYGSCAGTDAVSDEMLGFLAAEGIGTGTIRRLPDRTVGLYMISLSAGERSFSYWRGQSAARALADDPAWLAQILTGAERVHFSAITLAILPPAGRAALAEALATARRQGAQVSFDTNLRPRLWEGGDAMRAGLRLGASVADVVPPSFDEDGPLFDDPTPEATLARYRNLGAGSVVLKQGAGPMLWWDAAEGEGRVTPRPVAQVVDTTAAGDSLAAGLLAARMHGQPMPQAVAAGADLAARVIQAPGALVPDALAPDALASGARASEP